MTETFDDFYSGQTLPVFIGRMEVHNLHKSLIYAFQQNLLRSSPRQARYLRFYWTILYGHSIRPGRTIVANMLSRGNNTESIGLRGASKIAMSELGIKASMLF